MVFSPAEYMSPLNVALNFILSFMTSSLHSASMSANHFKPMVLAKSSYENWGFLLTANSGHFTHSRWVVFRLDFGRLASGACQPRVHRNRRNFVAGAAGLEEKINVVSATQPFPAAAAFLSHIKVKTIIMAP